MKPEFSAVVGIDVAKSKLDIAFSDETFSIEYTKQAIVAERIGRIDSESALVVMEATGGYEERLVSLSPFFRVREA